jgi:hypothetical protein
MHDFAIGIKKKEWGDRRLVELRQFLLSPLTTEATKGHEEFAVGILSVCRIACGLRSGEPVIPMGVSARRPVTMLADRDY